MTGGELAIVLGEARGLAQGEARTLTAPRPHPGTEREPYWFEAKLGPAGDQPRRGLA